MSRPLGVHLAQCQVPGENQESLLWVWWGRDLWASPCLPSSISK